MLVGGMAYLMNHLPDEGMSNIYYWYYATQAMHNMCGYEWDTWNRKIRRTSRAKSGPRRPGCASGSSDPANDAWGKQGGRLMKTSLSVLSLQMYYEYLPLYKIQDWSSEETDKGTSVRQGEK